MSQQTITLGGRELPVQPIPWGKLRKMLATINRVGMAVAVGHFDDKVLDDMTEVLRLGYGLEQAELDEMPTTLGEIQLAFEALVKVSGLEESMEKALGEARRAGLMATPATPTSIPGTPSTPT